MLWEITNGGRRTAWWRHCPISFEGPASEKESKLCPDIAACHINRQYLDEYLMFELYCESSIYEQHAYFQRVDDVKHSLSRLSVLGTERASRDEQIYLLRQDNDL